MFAQKKKLSFFSSLVLSVLLASSNFVRCAEEHPDENNGNLWSAIQPLVIKYGFELTVSVLSAVAGGYFVSWAKGDYKTQEVNLESAKLQLNSAIQKAQIEEIQSGLWGYRRPIFKEVVDSFSKKYQEKKCLPDYDDSLNILKFYSDMVTELEFFALSAYWLNKERSIVELGSAQQNLTNAEDQGTGLKLQNDRAEKLNPIEIKSTKQQLANSIKQGESLDWQIVSAEQQCEKAEKLKDVEIKSAIQQYENLLSQGTRQKMENVVTAFQLGFENYHLKELAKPFVKENYECNDGEFSNNLLDQINNNQQLKDSGLELTGSQLQVIKKEVTESAQHKQGRTGARVNETNALINIVTGLANLFKGSPKYLNFSIPIKKQIFSYEEIERALISDSLTKAQRKFLDGYPKRLSKDKQLEWIKGNKFGKSVERSDGHNVITGILQTVFPGDIQTTSGLGGGQRTTQPSYTS